VNQVGVTLFFLATLRDLFLSDINSLSVAIEKPSAVSVEIHPIHAVGVATIVDTQPTLALPATIGLAGELLIWERAVT